MALSTHEFAHGLNAFAACKSHNEFWIKVGDASVPHLSPWPPDLNNFVSQSLVPQPDERATTDELLQHLFVAACAWHCRGS